MKANKEFEAFISRYNNPVLSNSLEIREILFSNLPNIIEQIDLPAKMIAYCYGQKYIEMICAIIPSKKGLKLGFYKGVDLPDPEKMLEGTGKISRYIEIKSDRQIKSPALKKLLADALIAYRQRMAVIEK